MRATSAAIVAALLLTSGCTRGQTSGPQGFPPVTVKLANHEGRAADLRVRAVLARADGAALKETEATARVEAGGRASVVERLALARPRLWDGTRDPYLYKVYVEVYKGRRLRDRVEQPLGLRFFSVNADEGFFLNGRPLDLRGVSRHQDRLNKGWAISEADERGDFALIREMGANAIRVAHYQQSPLWDSLADKHGMVMWAEIPFVGPALDQPTFIENAKEQLRELIRQTGVEGRHPVLAAQRAAQPGPALERGQEPVHRPLTERAEHRRHLVRSEPEA